MQGLNENDLYSFKEQIAVLDLGWSVLTIEASLYERSEICDL